MELNFHAADEGEQTTGSSNKQQQSLQHLFPNKAGVKTITYNITTICVRHIYPKLRAKRHLKTDTSADS
jgi:hypothetical protein